MDKSLCMYVGIYRPYTALHRSDSFVSLWFKTVKMNGLYLESVSVDAIGCVEKNSRDL